MAANAKPAPSAVTTMPRFSIELWVSSRVMLLSASAYMIPSTAVSAPTTSTTNAGPSAWLASGPSTIHKVKTPRFIVAPEKMGSRPRGAAAYASAIQTFIGTMFVTGCFAIAALPPFNGFVSEWLTLQSLLRVVEVSPVPVRIVFAFSGALLALTAGLAVTCFAMLAASTLLGLPRSREASAVPRMPASVTAPMTILAIACLGLGVWATGVIPVLGRMTASLTGVDPTDALVPAFFGDGSGLAADVVHDLSQLGAQLGHGLLPLRGLVVLHSDGAHAPVVYAMSTLLTFVVLVFMLLVVWAVASAVRRRRRVSRRAPWNGGILRLQPEMTYTATTFSSPVRVLFHAIFNPQVARKEERQGAFLTARTHNEVHIDIVDRLFFRPGTEVAQGIARWLARMHHGKVTVYAAYVLVALVVVTLAAVASLS